MPMYSNIGGGAKQFTSLYINKNGTRNEILAAYGNIDGSSKQIYIKIYKWAKYSVETYYETTTYHYTPRFRSGLNGYNTMVGYNPPVVFESGLSSAEYSDKFILPASYSGKKLFDSYVLKNYNDSADYWHRVPYDEDVYIGFDSRNTGIFSESPVTSYGSTCQYLYKVDAWWGDYYDPSTNTRDSEYSDQVFFSCFLGRVQRERTNFIEYVTSTDKSAYPSNGMQNGYKYVRVN